MSGKHRANRALLGLSVIILALAAGCQQFFTTSLAKPLARPPVTMSSISADQAASLVAAKPNQALASSAVGALANLVSSNASSPTVVSNAAQVAVVATGLDTALTQAIASVNVTALTSGQSLSSTDVATLSNLLTGAAGNVNANTTTIFDALATQAKADPAALAASGTSAQTLVVAAAAVAIHDATSQLAPGQTLANVINGTATYTSGAKTYTPSASVSTTLSNLASGANAIDPTNPLLSTLQSSLNLKF